MRECSICGDQVNDGMTDDAGTFYCHEKCFGEYMDKHYGKHQWMKLGERGVDNLGGYYLVSSDESDVGYCSTGIFYTEWEDEADD